MLPLLLAAAALAAEPTPTADPAVDALSTSLAAIEAGTQLPLLVGTSSEGALPVLRALASGHPEYVVVRLNADDPTKSLDHALASRGMGCGVRVEPSADGYVVTQQGACREAKAAPAATSSGTTSPQTSSGTTSSGTTSSGTTSASSADVPRSPADVAEHARKVGTVATVVSVAGPPIVAGGVAAFFAANDIFEGESSGPGPLMMTAGFGMTYLGGAVACGAGLHERHAVADMGHPKASALGGGLCWGGLALSAGGFVTWIDPNVDGKIVPIATTFAGLGVSWVGGVVQRHADRQALEGEGVALVVLPWSDGRRTGLALAAAF